MTDAPDPIRNIIGGAAPAVGASEDGSDSEPPRRSKLQLPPECRIVPLGTDGQRRWYLDYLGQLIGLLVKEHSKLNIQGLFCEAADLVCELWPRCNEKGDVIGWRAEVAAEILLALSGKRLWSPRDRARGRGCWRDANGDLVVHAGTGVLRKGRWYPPGLLEDEVYPAAQPIMRPSVEPEAGGGRGVGTEVLKLLNTWSWSRPIDARLTLGLIGCAFLGAALDWRPIAWLTGRPSSGKSTLMTTLDSLLGGWLIPAADATAAALWQSLGHDCLGLALDETETESDPRRINSLVKLARVMASGGRLRRGGADHDANEFTLHSTMLFSSIRYPALLPQDRQRMIILRLDALSGEPSPDLSQRRLRMLGTRLLRRTIDGWPRFSARFDQFRIALVDAGHGGRSAQLFGTVLAAADVILSDDQIDSDSAHELAAQLAIDTLGEAEDALRDEEAWLRHLLSCVIPLDGVGGRNTVAAWMRQAVNFEAMESLRIEADRVLSYYGVKILRPKSGARPTEFAIANRSAGLERLHVGTHWAGRSGAPGVWVQAARDLEGSHVTSARFAGTMSKGTAIPLLLAVDLNDDDEPGGLAAVSTP